MCLSWFIWLCTCRVPDLLVLDIFSVALMDWASAHNVPFVIYHAGLLGVIGGYADTFALPDSFLGYPIAEHQTVSLGYRPKHLSCLMAVCSAWQLCLA
jgi:hypothetical protein